MDPIVGGALITGGSGLIGGALSSSSSAKAAARAVKAQINWERERAQNAHQWEVQDLMKAGLNPILSAGGSGAVTGGISAPVPDTSGINSAGAAIGQAVNDFIENKKKQAETGLIGEQTANIRQDTANKVVQEGLYRVEQELTKAKLGLIPHEVAKAKAEAELKKIEAEFGKATKYSEIARNYANAIGSVIGAGGISAMALSKIAKARNKVPMNKNYDKYYPTGGYEEAQRFWGGSQAGRQF